MWNRVLNAVFRKEHKSEYEKYKKSLEHVVETLTKVLEKDDPIEIIVFGEAFRKAFTDKEVKK